MRRDDEAWPGQSCYQAEAGLEWEGSGRYEGETRCDVAIIGAGLAGISTAIALKERGVDSIRVLDADQPGAGASGRNGGFVFAGYSLGNDALLRQLGAEQAARLHGWTREAVRLVRERIERYDIDCDCNDAGVVLADWFGDDQQLLDFSERMARQLGFTLQFLNAEALSGLVDSPRYGGGLFEPGSFHFQPLKHIRGLANELLAQGLAVHPRSPVLSLQRSADGWRIETRHGLLHAREAVLSTGGYDRRLWRPLQQALQPIATYIAVTEPLGERLRELLPGGVAVYDTRFAFDYFRPLPDGRLLWGGRISVADRSPRAIRRLLARDLEKVFPCLRGVRFEQAWGGWMSYARHEMPILGRTAEGLWHGLAFGGHGMATTTLAGEVLAEALCGQPERLHAFRRWQPKWAGGWAGRCAVQARYWWLQARDVWRDRLGAKGP
jgi:gamma-glutamylputrescine oxidase